MPSQIGDLNGVMATQEQNWLDQAADIMAARRLLAKEEANV